MMTPVPTTSRLVPPERFTTLMETTLSRTLRTARDTGVSRLMRTSCCDGWLFSAPAPLPSTATPDRTARVHATMNLRIALPFGGLATSAAGAGSGAAPEREAHGFPSPPHDGFGLSWSEL